VSEFVDNLLEDLHGLNRAVTGADPIPASPEKLKDDQQDIRIVLEDLERLNPQIHKVIESAKKFVTQGSEDQSDVDDLKSKISEINGLCNQVQDGALRRDKALNDALQVSEKFFDLCGEVMTNLRDLKDNLISQEPPGVDPATVQEQQKELKELRKDLGKARLSLEECCRMGEQLGTLCGEPGLMEIRKQLEDIHHLADDVHDVAHDRDEDLSNAFQHAERFQHLLDSINSWLPLSEHKLENMKPVSSNPETLRSQINELS
ncbi:hypothetical protein ACJMK2_013615, partial [Sinanodonta woodiana]